jgi:hypothetical protein
VSDWDRTARRLVDIYLAGMTPAAQPLRNPN